VELEVKKQAATSSGGSASCVRGGSLARIMTVSQAWCANLAGDERAPDTAEGGADGGRGARTAG
jgi:hypothetical protein